MVFSSVPFIFYYLPLLLALYYIVPARFRVARNLVLLIASLLFYAWGEGKYIIVMLISIGLNHYFGRRLSVSNTRTNLAVGISLNLFILGFYKYAGFISGLFGATDWNTPQLPLGISFFTFQAISYLIDVSRKEAPATQSLADTALYICSFPQLIAGPIVRYKDVALQLVQRRESVEQFSLGVKIFIIGLAQKVLIANTVGEVADTVFNAPIDTLSTAEAWYGLTAYSLQIFFDFAGYSNMAIGLGHMLGFTFPKNFNTPYSALSVTEFWRRWHMTLSSWFRDYLYIPLGGNRVSSGRAIANLWIVFVLCGFWHGANWTFVLWGVWHGVFLSIERLGLNALLANTPRLFRNAYLLLAIFLGWVLFRADTVEHAINYYQVLLNIGSSNGTGNLVIIHSELVAFMAFALLCSTQHAQKVAYKLFNGFEITTATEQARNPALECAAIIVIFSLFLLSIAMIAGGSYNPFIYFRF